MKKVFLSVCLIIALLPYLVQASTGRVKGWVYGSVIDGTIGLPKRAVIGIGRFAIGFPPPYGFGIGVTVSLFWSEVLLLPRRKIFSYTCPISIYYLPYARWDEKGRPSPVIYSYLQINTWHYHEGEFVSPSYSGGGSYLRLGIGSAWQVFHFSPSVEGGFYICSSGVSVFPFYLGIKFSLGGWAGLD